MVSKITAQTGTWSKQKRLEAVASVVIERGARLPGRGQPPLRVEAATLKECRGVSSCRKASHANTHLSGADQHGGSRATQHKDCGTHTPPGTSCPAIWVTPGGVSRGDKKGTGGYMRRVSSKHANRYGRREEAFSNVISLSLLNVLRTSWVTCHVGAIGDGVSKDNTTNREAAYQ
jgi:hypothetical protein